MNRRRCARSQQLIALLSFVLFPVAVVQPVSAQTFDVGELYLLSPFLPTINNGVLRIDPLTGADSVLVDLPDTSGIERTLSWDPFRNRLLAAMSISIGGFITIDAAGNVVFPLPAEVTPDLVAARGDGIVYLRRGVGLRYVDASDTAHDVLDAPGTGPYSVAVQAMEMIYDPGTNSLLLFQATSASGTICPDTTVTCAVKIPLTPDGTQVAGAETVAQISVSTTSEAPTGSGYAPGGYVLLVVDTNSNASEPRMLRLDPSSMVFSTWASNGPYSGANSTEAGTYSSVRGQAVILDTLANRLRAFGLGAVGDGILLGTAGFSGGVIARLVEIHTTTLPAQVPVLGMWGLVLLALALVGAPRLFRRRR